MTMREGIDPAAPPSGTGCKECLESGGWWVHLRRCAQCGHIGCCNSSPSQHATGHFHETGHPVVRSFEPGETWFFDYVSGEGFSGPDLAPPMSRPPEQPVPAPTDRLPADWTNRIR
jgi:hypothetical protein